jgi:hypothetical protein
MRRPVLAALSAACAALALAGGCAQILGLEPPLPESSGSGASSGTGATGGGGSTGGGGDTSSTSTTPTPGSCTMDSDCPVAGLPPCQKAVCMAGSCQSADVTDGDIPCYDGPAGTEDVGTCKRGTQKCTNGKPAGGCSGEVLPKADDCHTAEDENCDGKSPPCPGGVIDALIFSASGQNDLRDVVAAADGSLFVSGTYHTATSFAGCPLPAPPAAGAAAFVMKLSSSLKCSWVSTLAGQGTLVDVLHLAVSGGHVWGVGSINSHTEIQPPKGLAVGLNPLDDDAILVGFSADDGSLFSAFTIGGDKSDLGVGVAADGGVYALVQGGDGVVKSADGLQNQSYKTLFPDGQDGIVVGVDGAAGTIAWTSTFGSNGLDAPRALAAGNGRLYVGGALAPGAADPACIQNNGAVARAFAFDMDAKSGTIDSVPPVCLSLASLGDSYVVDVAPLASGNVAAAGYFGGIADNPCFKGGADTPAINGMLAVYVPQKGCSYVKTLNGASQAFGVQALELGTDVIFAGAWDGSLLGATSQLRDLFFHRYGADLSDPKWHTEVGGSGSDTLSGMTILPDGSAIVAVGTCMGDGFAGMSCDPQQGDGFLLRIAP